MNVRIRDSVISYEQAGSGMPVLVLHGLELDRVSMKTFLEPVFAKRKGFKRIYLDLPGMGKSQAGASLKSTDDMLNVVVAFAEEVIPEQPFLVAGLSYGGYLARGLAERLPERIRGLLLVCPVIYPSAANRQLEEHAVIRKDEAFLETLKGGAQEAFRRDMAVQTPDTYRRYQEEIAEAVARSDQAFINGDFFTKHYSLSQDPDRSAEAFTYPVSIITGRQDAVTGYKDAMALSVRYPHASFAVLDAAGHYVQIEQKKTAEEMAGDWLLRCQESQ